jgi:hypothetical protein
LAALSFLAVTLPGSAHATGFLGDGWCGRQECTAWYTETLRSDWRLWGSLGDTRVVRESEAHSYWDSSSSVTAGAGLGDGLLTSTGDPNGAPYALSYDHEFAPSGVVNDILSASVLVFVWDPSRYMNYAEIEVVGDGGTGSIEESWLFGGDGAFKWFSLFSGSVTGLLEYDAGGILHVSVFGNRSFQVIASVLKVQYNNCPVIPEPSAYIVFPLGILVACVGVFLARSQAADPLGA